MSQIFSRAANKHGLLLLLLTSVSTAHAQNNQSNTAAPNQLEEIIVTSGASDKSLSDSAQAIRVLNEKDLHQQSGSTLGELLQNTPGLANASFGSGVGRPVLRGLGANRVRVLSNGSGAADVSAMSSDHASMVDPVNADQIEIIQGPATLVFGGGAIGGIVNVVDNRIHNTVTEGLHGRAKTEFSSNDDGRLNTALLDYGFGNWVIHGEVFERSSDNYRSGDNPSETTTVGSSAVEASGGNLALSWIPSEQIYTGLSLSFLDYDYGVPNDHNEAASLTPQQTRLDYELGISAPVSGIDKLTLSLSMNKYEHDENEDDTAVGRFEQDAQELKLIAQHSLWQQWQGSWGLHWQSQELSLCHDELGCDGIPDYSQTPWDGLKGNGFISLGGFEFAETSPMPITQTDDIALFWTEEYQQDKHTIELGVRWDQRTISADVSNLAVDMRQAQAYYDDKQFDTVNINTAYSYQLSSTQKVAVSIARAQRAPDANELYWHGAHHATFSYQLPNAQLNKETANTLNLNWQLSHGKWFNEVSVFYYDFDNYIYNDLKPVLDPDHGDPSYRYEQSAAEFYGSEISSQYQLSSNVSIDWFADYVSAQQKHGNELPRIPPASTALAIDWHNKTWQWRSDIRAFASQNKVAPNEDSTPSYHTLNTQLSYDFGARQEAHSPSYNITLKANNLTNELGYNHVSYLKREAPVKGRNIILSLSLSL